MSSNINELKTLIRMNTSNFFKLISDLEKQKRISIQKALKLKRRAKYLRLRAASLSLYLLHGRPQDRRIWTFERKGQYWEDKVPNFDADQFKEEFRVNKDTFEWLAQRLHCLERQNTSLRKAIPLRKRLAIALYALGSNADYQSIANIFGVGRTTAGEIVRQFSKTLFNTLEDEYLNAYPPTKDKLNEIVKGFEQLGIPQCFGLLDERYIELRARKDGAIAYYDTNGKQSIAMLSVIDHKQRFSFLNFGPPGKCKKSTLFEKSQLRSFHEENTIFKEYRKTINNVTVPLILIGDSSFKLSVSVLTPFKQQYKQQMLKENEEETNNDQQQPEKEKIFNEKLNEYRELIANNAFKQLNARWRRLHIKGGIDLSVDSTTLILRACCLLHNICIDRNDNVWDIWLSEPGVSDKYYPIESDNDIDNDEDRNDNFGNVIRNNFAGYFLRLSKIKTEKMEIEESNVNDGEN